MSNWDTETCQYCGNNFHRRNMGSHEANCSSNPANKETK